MPISVTKAIYCQSCRPTRRNYVQQGINSGCNVYKREEYVTHYRQSNSYSSSKICTGPLHGNYLEKFMQIRSLIHLSPPDNLRHDRGTQFVSQRLQSMAAESIITCRPVGTASITRYEYQRKI